ncbi:hypothetical protein KIN20_018424 [Parelaphostrongylus tenuis]|uniref:Uncharacterized protein n=1 Tax=Parelaphostrongylus tenuis TaxID=148309 RepID=A0AAD5QS46_PARTN|nr:hypothetical protein KIN20_018424 [Parelaphostrongylus tenuis]
MRFNDNRWTRAVTDLIPRDAKRFEGISATRWSDFFTKAIEERYDAQRIPRERRAYWTTLAAAGKNGGVAGTRSSHSTINGTIGDKGEVTS